MHCLMNLDSKYHQVCTSILMMDDLPNASIVYHFLQQDERQKVFNKLTVSVNESLACTVDRRKFYHKKQDYPPHEKSISGTKRNVHYFGDPCKILGHSVDRCFKLHGYPSSSRRLSHKKVADFTYTNSL